MEDPSEPDLLSLGQGIGLFSSAWIETYNPALEKTETETETDRQTDRQTERQKIAKELPYLTFDAHSLRL